MKALCYALAVVQCIAQPAPQLALAKNTMVRSTYALTANEKYVGCFVVETDFRARVEEIDCSRAMPLSPKASLVRRFCVVLENEKLAYALADIKSKKLRWCEIRKAAGK